MQTVNCFQCQTINSNDSNFCKSCGTQMKCKKCSHQIESDSRFCSSCGEIVIQSKTSDNSPMNKLDFEQKGNSKKMNASFTNEVGMYFASAFNSLVSTQPLKPNNPFQKAIALPSPKNMGQPELPFSNIQDAEIIDNDYSSIVGKIFRETEEGKLEIVDNRLKEKSGFDKIKRLSVLFLYAQKMRGNDAVSREDLNGIITQQKLKLVDLRKFLAGDAKKYINHKDNGTYSVLTGGEEYAVEILNQIANTDYKATPTKAGRKPGKKQTDKTKIGSPSESSLKMKPSALESLKLMVSENYFKEKRSLNDMTVFCEQKRATKYSPQNIQMALKRLVHDKILDRDKNNDGVYEYWKK
jgi:hypothetical protein